MPSESLSDVKQRDWIRACRKLGLVVTSHGKGSHMLVEHPHNGTKYTLQYDLNRIINIKIFNKLKQWGFDEKMIFDALQ